MSDILIGLPEVEESDRVIGAPIFTRTTELPPGAMPPGYWADYFRKYRAGLEARKAALAAEADPDAEPPVRVVQYGTRVDADQMPTAAKKVLTMVLAAGWVALAQLSITEHDEVRFIGTSKADAKKPHDAGDVRWEAKRVEHFGIQAFYGEAAHFWATWDRIGTKTSFVGALIWDVAGEEYFETKVGLFTEWREIFSTTR